MKLLATSILSLAFVGMAAAQSGGSYQLTQSVIAGGGGGPSTGGTYAVTGTLGQPIAGPNISGGTYGLTSGFWTQTPLGTTAATVAVSGRVMDATGNPLRNVVIALSDSTGAVIVTRTNAFGYF